MSNQKKINVTWKKLENACDDICYSITNSYNKINFNCIVGVGSGGIIPARIISERLNISTIYMININNQKVEEFNKNIKDMNVLVVDDYCVSGNTINSVMMALFKYQPAICKICCLYSHKDLPMKPTYFFKEYNANSHYLKFPWEKNIDE